MTTISPDAQVKLEQAQNIWIASVRPGKPTGQPRPHLVPVWFAWHADRLYICIDAESIKGRNITSNPNVVLALEDGSNPIICEGIAEPLYLPWPKGVIQVFKQKYGWDITTDPQYSHLVEITPRKWLVW